MTRAIPLLAEALLGQVLAVRWAIAFGVETWHWFHSWLCHPWVVADVTIRKWSTGRRNFGFECTAASIELEIIHLKGYKEIPRFPKKER